MKPKFTPGPWRIKRGELRTKQDGDWASDLFAGKGESTECVAVVVQASSREAEISRHNARLIAAAPELYEMVVIYRKLLSDTIDDDPGGYAEWRAVNNLLKKIKGEP